MQDEQFNELLSHLILYGIEYKAIEDDINSSMALIIDTPRYHIYIKQIALVKPNYSCISISSQNKSVRLNHLYTNNINKIITSVLSYIEKSSTNEIKAYA